MVKIALSLLLENVYDGGDDDDDNDNNNDNNNNLFISRDFER